jgi:hypothetical protein
MWIRRHPVRAGVYAALLLGLALTIIFAGRIAGWLAGGPVGRAIAQRFGVTYRAEGVRLAWTVTDIGRLEGTVNGSPPVPFAAERVRIAGLRSVESGSLKFGGTIAAAGARIDLARHAAAVRDVRFAEAVTIAQGSATLAPARFEARGIAAVGTQVDTVSAGNVRVDPKQIAVDRVSASGVRVTAVRNSNGRWNVEHAASALGPAAAQLAREGATLRAAYARLGPRVRALLLWAMVIIAAVTVLAKILLTHRSLPLRLLSAGVVLLAPFLLVGRFGLWIALGAAAVVAVTLLMAVYWRTPEWHEKAEPFAVDLVGPALLAVLVLAYGFVYPPLPAIARTARVAQPLRIAQADADAISIDIDDGRNRVQIRIPRVEAREILAADRTQVQRVRAVDTAIAGAGWGATLPEVIASGIRASASSAGAARIDFRGEVESDIARRTLARYESLPEVLRQQVRVAFEGNGNASAPPLRFGVETTFRSRGIHGVARAEGTANAVSVTQVRTLPPSVLLIAGGRAQVALPPNASSTAHLAGLAARGFSAASLDVSWKPGSAETRVGMLDLPNVRIDSVLANAAYARDRVQVSTSTRGIAFRTADGAISGDIPQANTSLSARWRAGAVEGEIGFSSTRAAIDRPIRFTAELNRGTLHIPPQLFSIRQTAIPRAPARLDAELGVNALWAEGSRTADARLRIARLEPDVQPLGLTLNGIDISAAFEETAPRISIETGWNEVRYPGVPRVNRLQAIETFEANLRAKGDLLHPSLFEGWSAPAIPRLPERFRVSGVWPDLRLITDREERVVLSGLAARVDRLRFPQARADSIDAHFELDAIGSRRVDLRTDVSLVEALTLIKARGSSLEAPAFEIAAKPGRLDLSVPHLRPNLEGFQGALSSLTAGIDYAPGRIERIAGSVILDAGPLFDRKIAGGPLTSARARLPLPAKAAFALAGDAFTAQVSAPGFAAGASARAAGELSAEGSVETSVRLIESSEPATVLDALQRAGSRALPHYRRARDLFGPPPLEWRVATRQSPGNPFLRLSADRVELRGSFETAPFQTGDVAADVVGRERNLFLDAIVPLKIAGRASALNLPVELAIREPFPEPERKAALLWDASGIEKVWSLYHPRLAAGGEPLLDRRSLAFGGASVLEFTAPSRPVRAVVGLGDRIQLHAPVTARLLFGSGSATAQAELAWNGGTPELTARIDGAFHNLQAGAAGLAFSGIHHALVEDSFDGSFRLAANGVAISRDLFRGFEPLDRLDLSFQAARSSNQPGPGVVQLGFDSRVRLMNAVLESITDKIRFKVPPQLLTYRGLTAAFEARQGIVQTERPLLELSGVKVFTTDLFEIDANMRVRLGDRRSKEMPLAQLFRFAWGGAR